MTLIEAILLGIVEGLTEFLPISSTAHLMLTSELMSLPATEFVKTFEIAIQSGAILAVVVVHWRKLLLTPAVWTRVLAAFLPTAIIGFALHDVVKNILLESIPTVLWSLGVGGMILILFSKFHPEQSGEGEIEDISHGKAALIGLAQAVAIIPGVSRAAATIIGGELLGIKRKTVVEFSFLLAVPTIGAATVLDLLKSSDAVSMSDLPALLAGGITSFIVAILAIRWFLAFVKRSSFTVFGAERIIVALLFLLWWTA